MPEYFENCTNINEAKLVYRKLLKSFHPDHAGEEGRAITIEIINQFNSVSETFYARYM